MTNNVKCTKTALCNQVAPTAAHRKTLANTPEIGDSNITLRFMFYGDNVNTEELVNWLDSNSIDYSVLCTESTDADNYPNSVLMPLSYRMVNIKVANIKFSKLSTLPVTSATQVSVEKNTPFLFTDSLNIPCLYALTGATDRSYYHNENGTEGCVLFNSVLEREMCLDMK